MATVKFFMTWQVRGKATMMIPDDVVEHGEDAIQEYIEDNWAEVQDCDDSKEYVPGSDRVERLLDY